MKIKLELPSFVYFDKSSEDFDNTKLLSIRFDTTIYYVKNYDTGFSEFVFKILGLGVRITNEQN